MCLDICVRNVQSNLSYDTSLSHYEWKKEEEIIIHHTSTIKQCKKLCRKVISVVFTFVSGCIGFPVNGFQVSLSGRLHEKMLDIPPGYQRTDRWNDKDFLWGFRVLLLYWKVLPSVQQQLFHFVLSVSYFKYVVLDWVPFLLPIWEALFVWAFGTLINFSVTTAS